jgi:hypothetical protein
MGWFKKQVKAPGVDVTSGAEIDVKSGGALKIAGTAVTATAAQLNTAGAFGVAAVQDGSADGAITIKNGTVLITKAGVCALTLADPTAGTDDGKALVIVSKTANAHTVTIAGGEAGGGAAADVGTFGAAAGNWVRLVAYNGKWYAAGLLNVTFA